MRTKKLALLVDQSGSMGDPVVSGGTLTKLQAAGAALTNFFRALHVDLPGADMDLIVSVHTFNTATTQVGDDVDSANLGAYTIKQLVAAYGTGTASGKTNIWEAMCQTARYLADPRTNSVSPHPTTERILVVLTDGLQTVEPLEANDHECPEVEEPGEPYIPAQTLSQVLSGIQVHVLGFGANSTLEAITDPPFDSSGPTPVIRHPGLASPADVEVAVMDAVSTVVA